MAMIMVGFWNSAANSLLGQHFHQKLRCDLAGALPLQKENAWPRLTMSMDTMHAGMRTIQPSGNSDVDFVKLSRAH